VDQFGVESQNWTLSQFMHGEQARSSATARIVETVPWVDAKYYAATQVMDRLATWKSSPLPRHQAVGALPARLEMLLDDIINDSRWDMTYLGMQIMVEGLALRPSGSCTR
jgi:hypothetical protein